MEVVIDIPEEDYNQILNDREDAVVAHDACRRIAKGTILPDNHGRLIDADELHTKSKELYKTVQHSSERKMGYLIAMNELVIDAPTVLEASKE